MTDLAPEPTDWLTDLLPGVDVEAVDDVTSSAIAAALDLAETDVRRATVGLARAMTDGAGVAGYEIRTNTWRIDLPAAAAKSLLCGSVTALVLQFMGADAIPPAILGLVAPFLFEIDRVELDVNDLVLHCAMSEAAADESIPLADLYERLPPSVRSEVGVRDFGALLDRLVAARLAHVGPDGVRVVAPGRARGFRVVLR